MKSTLIRLTTLGLLTFGAVAFAQTDTANQNLTANMASEIDVAIGADPAQRSLSTTGTNDIQMTMTVNSTNSFQLYATTDAANNGGLTNGQFNEYDTGSGTFVTTGGKTIAAPHTVEVATDAQGTGQQITLPGAVGPSGLIYTGNVAVQAKSVTATLKVTPPFGTQRLSGTRIYRMVITYTLNVNP